MKVSGKAWLMILISVWKTHFWKKLGLSINKGKRKLFDVHYNNIINTKVQKQNEPI